MFEKYYNGVIEQVYGKVNDAENNIVMVCYNNTFSVEGLDVLKRYSKQQDSVFLHGRSLLQNISVRQNTFSKQKCYK